MSVTCAWENGLAGGTHTFSLLLLKCWGAQADLQGRPTSGARVSWDTRDLCQRGEVGPREHEPVPGSASRPALLMRDNEVHLISAADLPPGYGGCRQSPRQGPGVMEGLGQEDPQPGPLRGWGLWGVREQGGPGGGRWDSAGVPGSQGLIQPLSMTPAHSRGNFFPVQTSPG